MPWLKLLSLYQIITTSTLISGLLDLKNCGLLWRKNTTQRQKHALKVYICNVCLKLRQIHVSPERYKLYSALNPIYAQIFSTIADESRFHSCQWRNDCRRHSYRTTTIHPVPVTGDHVRALDPVSHILRTDFPKSCPVPNRIVSCTVKCLDRDQRNSLVNRRCLIPSTRRLQKQLTFAKP